ncbi:MAG TPA: serine/threonine-protein kinase, partial [Gemmatimonadaceae bacterium]
IHRDIKPENILLERGTDSAIVTDFGIARLMEAAPQTATGQILGTVHYMSPEQILGERVDGRSDIYSLGVVAFRAVTGKLPFDAKTATAVLVEHVTKDAPTVETAAPKVPASLAKIIDRCLAKDSAQRYQSAGDLAKALGDVMHSLPAAPTVEAGVLPTDSRILSEREANAVWSRAAQLQAETGVRTSLRSVPPTLGPPTAHDRRTRTSGYRLNDVKDAAAEVGIPERYVDKARAELGLDTVRAPVARGSKLPELASAGTAQSLSRPGAATKRNFWVGSPTAIVVEREVQREARSDDYELILHMIQRALGEPGHVSILGKSFHWSSSHAQRRLQITVVPRNGRTTIRADERLQPIVGGVFGGVLGGGGGGVGGGAMMPITIATTHSVIAGFTAWGATIATAYFVARRIFRGVRSSREADLTALANEIAEHVGG